VRYLKYLRLVTLMLVAFVLGDFAYTFQTIAMYGYPYQSSIPPWSPLVVFDVVIYTLAAILTAVEIARGWKVQPFLGLLILIADMFPLLLFGAAHWHGMIKGIRFSLTIEPGADFYVWAGGICTVLFLLTTYMMVAEIIRTTRARKAN
jgi:hypothetical protein